MTGSAPRKSACLTVIMGAVDEAVTTGKLGRHRLDGLTVRAHAQGAAQIIPATTAQLTKLCTCWLVNTSAGAPDTGRAMR